MLLTNRDGHWNHSAVMYVNLYGNSTAYQCLYMLQDLKLGQYTKLPPRATFAAQMAGSIIGSIFNYTSKHPPGMIFVVK